MKTRQFISLSAATGALILAMPAFANAGTHSEANAGADSVPAHAGASGPQQPYEFAHPAMPVTYRQQPIIQPIPNDSNNAAYQNDDAHQDGYRDDYRNGAKDLGNIEYRNVPHPGNITYSRIPAPIMPAPIMHSPAPMSHPMPHDPRAPHAPHAVHGAPQVYYAPGAYHPGTPPQPAFDHNAWLEECAARYTGGKSRRSRKRNGEAWRFCSDYLANYSQQGSAAYGYNQQPVMWVPIMVEVPQRAVVREYVTEETVHVPVTTYKDVTVTHRVARPQPTKRIPIKRTPTKRIRTIK